MTRNKVGRAILALRRLARDLTQGERDQVLKDLSEELRNAPRTDLVEAPPLFYIMNRARPVGNSVLWWRVDGHGYTCNLAEAWQVPKETADEICRCRPKDDFAMPVELVDQMAESHVHVDRLCAAGLLSAGWMWPHE
jgi:hypothetical protein